MTLDPEAIVPLPSTEVVVDQLDMIAGWTGKPTGTARSVTVRTSEPERDFTVSIASDKVSLSVAETAAGPDLELPAEAFVRLIYGRLDPEHTPPVKGDDHLDGLRQVFPGP